MDLLKMILATATAGILVAGTALAQPTKSIKPGGAAEVSLGYAGFPDDGVISHALIGGSGRWYVTRRFAVGPELVYMVGPGDDRDLFVTGNVTFDFRAPVVGRRPVFVPYLVGGAGFFQHRDRFGSTSFSSNEGAFTAGGGARAWISRNTYVAGEVRTGWEPHLRFSAHVGIAFGP